MISKRFPRHSSAQESLRQFALNCSKGVDESTPVTDTDTVMYTKNLVRNPDGSMSIRKPIKQLPMLRVFEKIYPLHDPEYYIGVWSGLGVFSNDGLLKVRIACRTYTGSEIVTDTNAAIPLDVFTDLEVLPLNTTTAVGCNVNFKRLEAFFKEINNAFNYSILNPSLYDADDYTHYRYLQVYYDKSAELWRIDIKTPEVNTLNIAEGELPLNPNLVLDNPYAIRDEYDASLPSVKSIIAYVPSKLENGKPVYDFQTLGDTYSAVQVLNHSWHEPSTSKAGDEQVAGDLLVRTDVTCTFKRATDSRYVTDVTIDLTLSTNSFANVLYTIDIYSMVYFDFKSGTDVYIPDVAASTALSRVLSGYVFKDTPVKHTITFSRYADYDINSIVVGGSIKNTLNISSKTKALPQLFERTVAELSESVKSIGFRPVSSFGSQTCDFAYLKAFCALPSPRTSPENRTYYATWLKSSDGVTWEPVTVTMGSSGITVREAILLEDESDENAKKYDYKTVPYYPLVANSPQDIVLNTSADVFRADVLQIPDTFSAVQAVQYMFKIAAVSELDSEAPEYDKELKGSQYRVDVEYGRAVYTPVFKDEFEFLETNLGNAAAGKKLYYKRAIYSYGDEKFENNIFATDVDSFITPLYNVIDVDTVATPRVTSLIPWRDYLISATNSSIHLHQKVAEGYTTKILTTSVGIPESDSRCCQSVLNSIIFKSGSKIYRMYPGAYSSDDTVLNITDISVPIESMLYDIGETENNFAFSTSTEYVLMMPYADGTHCLRYDYADKIWTYCNYPVQFDDYRINNLDDIRVYGYIDGYIGKSLVKTKKYVEFLFDYKPGADEDYADILETGSIPINFEYDTGQKTDSISRTKQFVESKLVFATLDEKDSFPFTLQIAIDGDPHVTTKDVSTDAPFWKTDNSIGVAGTAFRLTSNTEGAAGIFNTLRQLVVRYSGKGKSIRHRIVGESVCNFKLYETYVRYKNLSGK